MIGKPAREKVYLSRLSRFSRTFIWHTIPRTASSGMSARNTQPCPLRIETPPRRGDLVRLVLLVRTFLHKNKQDAGESASMTAKTVKLKDFQVVADGYHSLCRFQSAPRKRSIKRQPGHGTSCAFGALIYGSIKEEL
jgi:hypothetical protein